MKSPTRSPDLVLDATRENRLLSLRVEVTHRCDLACVHCYQSGAARAPGMPGEDLRRVLEEAAEEGALFLHLTGGEIFLRDDILDLVAHARSLHYLVRLSSHGGRIDDRVADALARMAVFRVSLSLYSDRSEVHDRITRRPGSHAATLAAAWRLLRRGVRVNLVTVVMKANQGAWQGVASLAEEMGAGFVLDSLVFPSPALGVEHARRLAVPFGEKVQVSAVPSKAGGVRNGKEGDGTPPGTARDLVICRAGRSMACVMPSGLLYPCGLWPEPAGDLTREGLSRIWRESPVLLRVRGLNRGDIVPCRDCAHLDVCGLCPGIAASETGRLLGRSPLVCERTRARLLARGAERVEVPPAEPWEVPVSPSLPPSPFPLPAAGDGGPPCGDGEGCRRREG